MSSNPNSDDSFLARLQHHADASGLGEYVENLTVSYVPPVVSVRMSPAPTLAPTPHLPTFAPTKPAGVFAKLSTQLVIYVAGGVAGASVLGVLLLRYLSKMRKKDDRSCSAHVKDDIFACGDGAKGSLVCFAKALYHTLLCLVHFCSI